MKFIVPGEIAQLIVREAGSRGEEMRDSDQQRSHYLSKINIYFLRHKFLDIYLSKKLKLILCSRKGRHFLTTVDEKTFFGKNAK